MSIFRLELVFFAAADASLRYFVYSWVDLRSCRISGLEQIAARVLVSSWPLILGANEKFLQLTSQIL